MKRETILYKNKYRIKSARLQGWNYASGGYYFVTICSFDRNCIFGEIINDKMELNKNGGIVHQEWEKTFEMRPELRRDEYCIMPNHFHAVARIINSDQIVVETHGRASLRKTPKQPCL